MTFVADVDLQVAETIPGKAGLLAGEYLITRRMLREIVKRVEAGANLSAIREATEAAKGALPEHVG